MQLRVQLGSDLAATLFARSSHKKFNFLRILRSSLAWQLAVDSILHNTSKQELVVCNVPIY